MKEQAIKSCETCGEIIGSFIEECPICKKPLKKWKRPKDHGSW